MAEDTGSELAGPEVDTLRFPKAMVVAVCDL